jgi:hypothetical protein
MILSLDTCTVVRLTGQSIKLINPYPGRIFAVRSWIGVYAPWCHRVRQWLSIANLTTMVELCDTMAIELAAGGSADRDYAHGR